MIIAVGGLFYVQVSQSITFLYKQLTYFTLCVSLSVFQMKIILNNRTSIEDWIVIKAESRHRSEEFIYPYDLGYWNNFMQVFRKSKSLDGIDWPLREGCHQYTLTYEQVLQKMEKRSRARNYKVINCYNGNWFPLFTQGWRTCIKFPFSDEARISLDVNDEVTVTRWKKHWLYGEKTHPVKLGTIKPRGWFPRRCVVEMVQDLNQPRAEPLFEKVKNLQDLQRNSGDKLVNRKIQR